jgi:hypothetical protein
MIDHRLGNGRACRFLSRLTHVTVGADDHLLISAILVASVIGVEAWYTPPPAILPPLTR